MNTSRLLHSYPQLQADIFSFIDETSEDTILETTRQSWLELGCEQCVTHILKLQISEVFSGKTSLATKKEIIAWVLDDETVGVLTCKNLCEKLNAGFYKEFVISFLYRMKTSKNKELQQLRKEIAEKLGM